MIARAMERTQIYLTTDESAALERESRTTGRSKSQLIRDAIDRVYMQVDRKGLLDALDRSAGSWRNRKESGAQVVEQLRSGRRLARLREPGRGRRR